MVTKTLESMPANSTHCSTRLMAAQTSLTQNASCGSGVRSDCRRIVSRTSNHPKIHSLWRGSATAFAVSEPTDRAIVLCVDEKSQVQALNRTQPILRPAPAALAHQSYDYEQHGVTPLSAAMDVASGVTISACYGRHRQQEFLRFLNQIEDNLPVKLDVHLVMDDYGTHKVEQVRNWLARYPRYDVHFTPYSGSWLNLVERLFAEVTERCVRRGSQTGVRVLERAMPDYLDRRNENTKPFVWTANAGLILGRVERLCKRIVRSGTSNSCRTGHRLG